MVNAGDIPIYTSVLGVDPSSLDITAEAGGVGELEIYHDSSVDTVLRYDLLRWVQFEFSAPYLLDRTEWDALTIDIWTSDVSRFEITLTGVLSSFPVKLTKVTESEREWFTLVITRQEMGSLQRLKALKLSVVDAEASSYATVYLDNLVLRQTWPP